MEKEIEINGKKYKIREMTYLEALDLDSANPKESAKQSIKICTGLTDEDLGKLSIKEGLELSKAINEINGIGDFQKATDEAK